MPTTPSPLPTAYLLSTIHSKDVRFPCVTLYQCGIFVHSYTLKLQAGGFCEMLVPVVATARYHTSKEFNPNADSFETFKCYVIVVTVMKILFHGFSFPGEY